jgi:predicted dithiol-disulfide oxidoreductase (DUF899 family)
LSPQHPPLSAYRDFMGWDVPWYSAQDSTDALLAGHRFDEQEMLQFSLVPHRVQVVAMPVLTHDRRGAAALQDGLQFPGRQGES